MQSTEEGALEVPRKRSTLKKLKEGWDKFKNDKDYLTDYKWNKKHSFFYDKYVKGKYSVSKQNQEISTLFDKWINSSEAKVLDKKLSKMSYKDIAKLSDNDVLSLIPGNEKFMNTEPNLMDEMPEAFDDDYDPYDFW